MEEGNNNRTNGITKTPTKNTLEEEGGSHPLARPDQEPVLRQVIGSGLDFPSGHGTERKGKTKTKNQNKKGVPEGTKTLYINTV